LSLQLQTSVTEKGQRSKNIFQVEDIVTIILKLHENKYRKEAEKAMRMKGH